MVTEISDRQSDQGSTKILTNSRAWWVVAVLLGAWVLAYLDRGIINLLAESIKAEIGLSDTQLSLIQGSAFSLSFALAGLPIGFLVDHYNRRNLIVAGILVWSVATAACGFANSFWTLFLARAFVGIGEACLAPAAFSIVADLFPKERRGRAMGVVMTGSSLGNAASILIGGLLIATIGQAPVYLMLLGRTSPIQIIFTAVAVPGLIVATLLFTFRDPPRDYWRDSKRTPEVLDRTKFGAYLWRNSSTFLIVYGLLVCNYVLATTSGIWVPVLLIRLYGVTPGDAGIWLGIIILMVGPAFGLLGGFLADRFSQKYPLNGRLRGALFAFPIQILFLGCYLVDDVSMVLLAYAGVSAFGNIIMSASYSALHDLVPPDLRGRIIALYLLVTGLIGLGLGPTLVALVTDHFFHDDMRLQDSLFVVLMPMAALGFILTIIAQKPLATVRRRLLQSAEVSHEVDQSW